MECDLAEDVDLDLVTIEWIRLNCVTLTPAVKQIREGCLALQRTMVNSSPCDNSTSMLDGECVDCTPSCIARSAIAFLVTRVGTSKNQFMKGGRRDGEKWLNTYSRIVPTTDSIKDRRATARSPPGPLSPLSFEKIH